MGRIMPKRTAMILMLWRIFHDFADREILLFILA